MQHDSTWSNIECKQFPPLGQDQVNVDVVVVGGGLAGLLSSYELAKRGYKVCVVESHRVGGGVTSYTTGFLTHVIDTELSDLIRMFGMNNARLIWESHRQAIDYVEQVVQTHSIDCEFTRCPNYVFAQDDKQMELLLEEKNAADQIGFGTSILPASELPFEQSGAWLVPNQAKFHAIKFIQGLLPVLEKMGVQIYEQTEAESLERRGLVTVTTPDGGQVIARDVIVATYLPFNSPPKTWFKKGMYRSYIFEARVPTGLLPEAIYEDLNNPYNYFRIDSLESDPGHDRLIIGGQDHRDEIKMDESRNYQALKEILTKVVHGAEFQIANQWDSKVLEPSDGLALIGCVNPHEYVATAFSGTGLTYSAIAAILLSDLIVKEKNAWTVVYDPQRVPSIKQLAIKGRDYTGELIGGAVKNMARFPKVD